MISNPLRFSGYGLVVLFTVWLFCLRFGYSVYVSVILFTFQLFGVFSDYPGDYTSIPARKP